MGFSVVAEFVVQKETKESIKKGLRTIERWINEGNTEWQWQPKFFMTDFSEREICAIEETFRGISILNSLQFVL